jgi:hypothetical protein
VIGKSAVINFQQITSGRTATKVDHSIINIKSTHPIGDASVQKVLLAACERSLKLQSEKYLPI